MTEYREISVDKRSLTILVDLPEKSTVSHNVALANDVRITRNGDTRIARNGDRRVAHNTIAGYPRIASVKKRSFTILVDKISGS